jgi:hypothetical protein
MGFEGKEEQKVNEGTGYVETVLGTGIGKSADFSMKGGEKT